MISYVNHPCHYNKYSYLHSSFKTVIDTNPIMVRSCQKLYIRLWHIDFITLSLISHCDTRPFHKIIHIETYLYSNVKIVYFFCIMEKYITYFFVNHQRNYGIWIIHVCPGDYMSSTKRKHDPVFELCTTANEITFSVMMMRTNWGSASEICTTFYFQTHFRTTPMN